MAVAAKTRVVVNSPRRARRNRRRRNLTPKQIKFFGTPAQKAALRRQRANSRTHRKRSTGAPFSRKRRKARANHRPRTRSQARRNPGDILSLVLGNPGGKRKRGSMARSRRKSSGRRTRSRSNYPRRRRRSNPFRAHRRRRHFNYGHRRRRRSNRRMNYRRNPAQIGLKQGVVFLVAGGAGFIGSKLITQIAMGANNTGVAGYLGNGVATAVLAFAAHMLRGVVGTNAAPAVLAGGVLQVLWRIATDNTSLGSILSSSGMGDYQMQAFVTPQRLTAPLDSAAIEIPTGWGAPAVAISSNAPPASVAAGMKGYNRTGGGTYTGGGLYAT